MHHKIVFFQTARKHMQNKSDKIVFFQTARHSPLKKNYKIVRYRTNCGLNKWKKHASQNSFFPNGEWRAIWEKTILSNLFCASFLVRLRAQFVRNISRIFPIYISDKLWSK